MKKKFLGFAVFCFTMILTTSIALATTYYVRTDGVDTNTGLENTVESAFQTIQHAADISLPGDVIMINAGNYAGVFVSKAGASGTPITYQGIGDVYVGGISFAQANNNLPYPSNIAYYVVFDNLKFQGSGSTPLTGTGISFSGVSRIVVKNCEFQGLENGLSFFNNYYTSNYYLTFSNCLFKNNVNGGYVNGGSGGLGSSTFDNCRFIGNDIGFNVPGYGVNYVTFSSCTFDSNRVGADLDGIYWYWFKSHHNTFTRSIFTNNTVGLILGFEGPQHYSHYGFSYANTVNNSIFYANTDSGIRINTNFVGANDGSATYYDSQGQTFSNNIFLNNGNYGIDNSVNQTIFASYNLAFGNGVAAGNNAIFDTSNFSLLADPLFIDPSKGNFNLKPESPCIDAGNPSYDADPVRFGSHIDIGAFEYIDTIAPATTAAIVGTAGASSWYVSDVTVNLVAADAAGVAEVRYAVDGGAEVVVAGSSAAVDFATEGSHSVSYYAVDIYGNIEATKSLQLSIDKSSPTTTAALAGTAGNNGWYRSAVTVSLASADTISGVKEIRYTINDGTPVVVAGAAASVQLPVNLVATISFWSVDNAGNLSAVTTQTISSDSLAPAVAATLNGTNGTNGWYRSAVSVSLQATDSTSSVKEVLYSVNGGATVAVSGSSATVSIPANRVSTIKYWAVDNAGNQSAAATQTISSDAVAPTVSVSVSPSTILGNNKLQSVKISGSAKDSLSGLVSTSITVTDKSGSKVASASAFGSTIQLKGVKGQIYTVTAVSTDKAGNSASSKATVTVK